MRSTRRELIAATAAGALTAAVPPAWGRMLSKRVGLGPGEFFDGVASGEPGPYAVTFWTRMETDRLRSGARLIVARDEGLRSVVATAKVPTGRAINGTLKVRVGGLKPHTEYYYGWESTSGHSDIGRTRTRPHPTSATPLRIAYSSCQNYAIGNFSAHANAAADTFDCYLFLGDYIYERARAIAGEVRTDPIDANDLASYRAKYGLYRSDPGLRELHRLHPALHIWDDHEVENNYSDNDPAPAPLQRSAAYRAAFEWLPRVVDPRDRFRIYRRLPFGTFAEVFLLDERQYRTGSNDGQPRHILGDTQMNWLIAGLKASRATWKIVANQVVISQSPYGDGPRPDMWGGYPEDRAYLLGALEAAGVRNVVFLTGDVHVFMCNLLGTDPAAVAADPNRVPAAVEYVGGSVTSGGVDRPEADVRKGSPWCQQYNGHDHGYALLSVDGSQLVTEYRRSDYTIPNGATTTFERFTQPVNVNRVTRETLAPV